MSLQTTSSQTIGPYLHIGLTWLTIDNLAGPGVTGDKVSIEGRIFDGEGNILPDAMVEVWQADAQGHYAHPADGRPLKSNSFRGFGRCPTGHDGTFKIVTLKPGPLPFGDGRVEAPHIDVSVFSRGMLDRSVTRIYFPDEAETNAADPVLQAVPEQRRATLIAVPAGENLLRFDIRMQGPDETVFFDL
jgi:protocatechuate 3,4-dioxygenase alpha subunit